MTDMYEDDDELVDVEDEFVDPAVETEAIKETASGFDARRRLESMLEERRLRDELDDFVDY